MPDTVSKKLFIHGTFPHDTFAHWISARALQLALHGWVRGHSSNLMELCVTGDRVLVDAMEVACSLGPIDAQVERIEIRCLNEDDTLLRSRHRAQFHRY